MHTCVAVSDKGLATAGVRSTGLLPALLGRCYIKGAAGKGNLLVGGRQCGNGKTAAVAVALAAAIRCGWWRWPPAAARRSILCHPAALPPYKPWRAHASAPTHPAVRILWGAVWAWVGGCELASGCDWVWVGVGGHAVHWYLPFLAKRAVLWGLGPRGTREGAELGGSRSR